MVVHFAQYRHFETSRTAANDAAMMLVAAIRLARVALDQIPEDQREQHLPELFDVPDIGRMNRSVADAVPLLEESERYLAYMTIPFILSVYQSLAIEAIRLLRRDGKDSTGDDPSLMKLERLHKHLMDECGIDLPDREIQIFEFLRQIRNRILHAVGIPGSHLRSAYFALSLPAREQWEAWTGRSFVKAIPDRLRPMNLGIVELTPALAVTKRLGKTVNAELTRRLSRQLWAQLVAEDYRELEPERYKARGTRLRKVIGLARYYYADLGLTDEEIAAGIEVLSQEE